MDSRERPHPTRRARWRPIAARRALIIAIAAAPLLGAAQTASAQPAQSAQSPQPAQASTHGQGLTVPTVASVGMDTALNNSFTTYGNSGAGWTGADSTFSTPLPGGRELFEFSDTFLGPITPPSRPKSALLVHNSFVQFDRGRMSTFVGGTPAQPDSLMSPTDPTHWFWTGDGTYLGGTLQVPVTEWRTTGTTLFDLHFVGNSLARFSLDNLHTPLSVTPLPSSAGIQWGQWIEPQGPYTYVYGVEDLGADKYLHVARVRGTDLRAPWQFFTGGDGSRPTSWSPREADSTRVMDYVENELSIQELHHGLYMLTTMDSSVAFGNQIVAYFAPSPTGPFTNKTALYATQEGGPYGTYGDPNVVTYNAHAHPELSTPNKVVISYNVNSLDTTIGGDVYRDVSIYRPRFIDVNLQYPTRSPSS